MKYLFYSKKSLPGLQITLDLKAGQGLIFTAEFNKGLAISNGVATIRWEHVSPTER